MKKRIPISMREIIFTVAETSPSHYEAVASQSEWTVSAPTVEELRLEARELLIKQLGGAHITYRIRLKQKKARPW
jgi:hypothetical protein